MHIQENISLKNYNTFGIDVQASHFVSVKSISELQEVLKLEGFPNKFVIGGGSNMLLTKDVESLVVHIDLKGVDIVKETDSFVLIKANSGENWHQFVLWCLQHDYGGIENLSLIPGNVGTAPIQNIGAYGVELKDVFVSCDAINVNTYDLKTFHFEDCKFGYRESIFKQDAKGQYIITSVIFKLTKKPHDLHTEYGAISSELLIMEVENPKIQDVSSAVIAIRQSKLPDPKILGNSGSFFKNPVISRQQFKNLKVQFPELPSYDVSELEVKIPAGWLIEKSGFKGKKMGNYGVHSKQALVLVNYGNAKGSDIFKLAQLIQKTIYRIFNIKIETEVNIF